MTEKQDDNEDLIPVFIPALVAILLRAEKVKGDALTEDEVLTIRHEAVYMMMTLDMAKKQEESRGYADLDPENCWEEWQEVRIRLAEEQDE